MPHKIRSLVGEMFGGWTVLAHAGFRRGKDQMWLCRCECGVERNVGGGSLKNCTSTNCGCRKLRPIIIGARFGKLTVINAAEKYRGQSQWLCRCDCGKEIVVRASNLNSNNSGSCGCLHQEKMTTANPAIVTHGLSDSPEYGVWRGMIQRCHDVNSEAYKNYGARGIKVCERWRNDFQAFITDMGKCPESLTIERKNNDGDYEPDNCHWATFKEQARNRRNSRIIEYQDETKTLAEWVEQLGLPYDTIWRRLDHGWQIADAFLTPVAGRS